MKARNTKTGKEITILGISTEWGTATYIEDGILHQENLSSGEWEIIDESAPIDWSSFRREAAKDILCALIGHKDSGVWTFSFDSNAKVEQAIAIADRLINGLKTQIKTEKGE